MQRRAFVAGMAAIGVPVVAQAQETARIWRIAALSAGSSRTRSPFRDAFRQGLEALGWRDGRNIALEWRYAEGRYDRLPDLAVEVVKLRPHIIVAASNAAVEALKPVTSTIPIVMVASLNPVGRGYIASLARPGGNITGVTWDADLAWRRIRGASARNRSLGCQS